MDTTVFIRIENELQRRREQKESMAGKENNFRVEFRFYGGSRAYEYYETLDQALNAYDYKKCSYGAWGNAIIESPSSRQIQIRGPRGGYKKYKEQRQ